MNSYLRHNTFPILTNQRYHIFVLLALLFTLSIKAQHTLKTPKFNHISVREGLSQSTVFCITQDQKDFMWFGTRSGGLNRYDGCTFKVFKHDPNDSTTISSNEVISILEDHKGNLWVGTRKGGLNRFDKKTERFLHYKTDNSNYGTSGNTINALFQDSKNRIWVASNAGLDLIIEGQFIKNKIPKLQQKYIGAIAEDAKGKICITDKKGLYIYNEKTEELKYHPFNENSTDPLNSDYSGPLYVDKQGQIWLGTTSGVKLFSQDSLHSPFESFSSKQPIPDAETRCIHQDANGNLWFGTITGLFRYNPKDKDLQRFTKDDNNAQSLSHSSIYSLYEDATGILWIGTWGGGVNMLSPKLFKFEHFNHQYYNANSISNNCVSSFAEDENGIWIGTESGGVNYLPHNSIIFEVIKKHDGSINTLNSDHIKTLLKSNSKQLYIGSYGGGLSSINPKNHHLKHLITNEKVFTLAEHPKGIIWVGTLNGLYRYNEETGNIKRYLNAPKDSLSIAHNFITSLFVTSNNTLWLGTKEAGLMKYIEEKDHFLRFSNTPHDSTSLLSNYVITMEEDINGNLLIGTNNGISIYNPIYQNFENLTITDLPDKNINGIICDKNNNYWISTNKGITKYSHQGTPVNYDINDGLQSNEFNRNASFQDKQGNIYFGGINGFNRFNPNQVPINNEIPKIKITNFKISNQNISPESEQSPLIEHITETKEIVLNHDQNDFSFEFVALNYIVPQKNQYAYKLEGYNNAWIYCGNQKIANYTSLRPGHYTFVVKGANNDNIWNEEGTSIRIYIKQPFWKTPFAYTLYALLLLTLLLLLRWLITMRIKQNNTLDLERMEKKQLEELNQMKLRFFTNIAHEFRTPLTLISGPLQELEHLYLHNQEQSYLIDVVQNNVRRLLYLVEELLDFRKTGNKKIQLCIKQVSMIDFIENTLACFRENAIKKNIILEFNHPIDPTTTAFFDQGVMDKILFNLLSNALKYTPTDGNITVTLEGDEQEAIIKVKDSGEGIAEKDIDKIFDRFYQGENSQAKLRGSGIGLAYAQRLVEAHKGQISVESAYNRGTTFTVKIPIQEKIYADEEKQDNSQPFVTNKHLPTQKTIIPEESCISNKNTEPYQMLIVEDNKELNAYLAFHFKAYKIETAFNGKEGLEKATKSIPDIIISDIMMPEMNGLVMCEKIKNQFLTSHIPIILLTAKSETDYKIEGLQYGADAYIEKPFENKLLEATIQNILKQREKLRLRLDNNTEISLTKEKLNQHDQRFIETVNKTIKEQLNNSEFSVETLAETLGMSRSQLFRKFKALYQFSPSETLRIERLNYAKQLIADKIYNINEISDMTGFSSTSYFITSFKKYFGITPTDYLKKR